MALFGGGNNGATISYGQTGQSSADGTVINDSGEIYVNFKIPCFSNASDVMPMQTLTDAQVGLDADDTLYNTSRLDVACQVLVAVYGTYYEGMCAKLFTIQSHYASASPANRIKITTVWTHNNKVHPSFNGSDTYPRIYSSDTSTGEFRLNIRGDYWNSNHFVMNIINGGGATPYVGNLTYDSRYGQDLAWK